MTGLERLLLAESGLQGTLEPLKNLTKLIEIDLSHNQLTSAIPYLVNSEGLEVMKLGHNQLQDVINDREGLRKLRKLTKFDVQENYELTCSAEHSFLEYVAIGWRNVEDINLSSTKIYTKLPRHTLFVIWPKLSVLRATGTPLEGSIPYSMNELTHMRELALDRPSDGTVGLRGELHPALGGMTSLEYLSLNGNAIDSTIPSELGALINLKELDLNNNFGIVGPIPTEIGNMKALETLFLSDTKITGTVPSELVSRIKRYAGFLI